MARYICPSCGAGYNGKKCKNCNYEALETDLKRGVHSTFSEPKPTAPQWDTEKPAAPQWNPGKRYRRQKRRIPPVLIVILILFFGVPLLQVILAIIGGTIFTLTSHHRDPLPDYATMPISDLATCTMPPPLPTLELPEIPSAQASYDLIYENTDYSIWADCQPMWREGVINLKVENRTGLGIALTANNVILNDQLLSNSSSTYIEVAKNDTATGTFFLEPVNQMVPINPAKVSFQFIAYDTTHYDTCLETDTIILTAPEGEIVPVAQPEGTLVWQGEDAQLFYISWVDLEWFPGSLRFGMINDTDRTLGFNCEKALINGQESPVYLYCELPPHTVAYDYAFFYSLEDLGITSRDQLTSVELQMSIYDEDSPDGIVDIPPFSVPIP